ncbi:MAG: DUF1015 domain-containing protein [Pseudomonadota bacterium]
MAEIAPLRGILYDEEKTGGMTNVVAPPYDVVSPDEQAEYHASHPQNVLHIDLGARAPEDVHPYDWHVRAAYKFNNWLAEGYLVRHDKPAVYYNETDFTDPATGQRRTRHGFVCLLRLEEFGADAKIRPHERTFSEHKAERLHHMELVQAHLSQVFSVFPDEELKSIRVLRSARTGSPRYDFTDAKGQGHRLWTISNPDALKSLVEIMREKTVYIADGHHRYETGLNYRRLKAREGVQIGPNSPLNYLLVYLCPVTDPGLAILPAHRLIKRNLNMSREELETAARKYFDVQTFSFNSVDETSAREAFIRQLHQAGRTGNALGLFTRLGSTYYLLKKKALAGNNGTALSTWPQLLRELDTVVLTSLVFQDILGMTDEDLDDASRIAYSSVIDDALEMVHAGQAELAAILNPTKMDQVQNVAEAGLVMPRKSTFFFPKVTSGLVFNFLNPFEEIPPLL